jgi:DNA polymerase-4/DNA polymerase IV (DinB-like DNA polymerase)
MDRTILSVDMDAFYASVEIRDDPSLRGKPLIIGALPHERGVVSTCSYEARKFGVRSAMSIKDAYRLCPQGVYMHPNPRKYREASDRVHKIWLDYTDIIEFISLDEGFLDVTGSAALFGGARAVALAIKERTKAETALTCSVGVGYSMMSAKLASEEKKPDGLYEILTPDALRALILDRGVRAVYGVGAKTAERLQAAGIATVRELLAARETVLRLLGNHGQEILDLAQGIDPRRVTPFAEAEAKSVSRETTFQKDTDDLTLLKDALRLLSKDLSLKLRADGLFARTVTLKVKYADMRLMTRSRTGSAVNGARDIFQIAASLLDTAERRPIRLVGVGASHFTDADYRQLSLEDMDSAVADERRRALDGALLDLQRRFGGNVIKTGDELVAEKRFEEEW